MKKILLISSFLVLTLILVSCQTTPTWDYDALESQNPHNDIYYQLFIRSFADSDNDGIGDFNGVTNNLDYIESLGVTAIWMLPYNLTNTDFLAYHGYHIKDYYEVNPEYGTMSDLENLIKEAKKKDIKIVMDLVINHTADTHPWFVNAKSSTTSEFRDYYIWTNDNNAFESFPGGMKDLNLDNPKVVTEIKNIIKFWIEKGIEGFRFDAAKHLFIGNPGTNPGSMKVKNWMFLHELRRYARTLNSDFFFLGEVFEYDYNQYSDYYKGLDSLFDFYIANEIWSKVGSRTNSYLLTSNLIKAYETYQSINPNAVPSLFIGNHDIDRVASRGEFSGANALNSLKQAASVLLTLPGSPHIYYGDEIGMKGKSYDGSNLTGQGAIYDQYRRSPFIWGNKSIETTWLKPYGDSNTTGSVKEHLENPNSLLNTYITFGNLRKNNPALMYGNYIKAYKGNTVGIQGYVRHYELNGLSQTLLVIHNLSSNSFDLDLEYLSFIHGNSLTIKPFETIILELDSTLINNYI